MKERIAEIKRLLDQVEMESESASPNTSFAFHAFDLPSLIQEIVDDLQPLLSPYEAAFYWYAFRHSIARDGAPHLRLSTRKLRGIVRSAYSTAKENTVSLGKVQEALRALEAFGASRREGEPNRDGTPYRVLIPTEIPQCREYKSGRIKTEGAAEVSPCELDFYNIKASRVRVFERDQYICKYCKKQLTRFTATLDHVTPVAEGGNNGFDNLVTACLNCNSQKNRRPLSDFLADVN